LDFKWINKEIAYISINSFNDWAIVNSFTDKLPELEKAKILLLTFEKMAEETRVLQGKQLNI
jgi:hypothetical protein